VEIRRMEAGGQPRQKVERLSQPMAEHRPVIPAMWGSTNRRIVFQASTGIKQDPSSKKKKNNQHKKGWRGVTQVVEYLPSKWEVLSSIYSIIKKSIILQAYKKKKLHCLLFSTLTG
jgi:hypothetical protein